MINNKKWYSIQEISKRKLIPFLDTDYKIKKYIDRGMLKGNTIGRGCGKRYFIKGNELIKFIARWESGDFHN